MNQEYDDQFDDDFLDVPVTPGCFGLVAICIAFWIVAAGLGYLFAGSV